MRPKERVGFGEPTIVRDSPGILVVEESHFPAWLWWSCWIGFCIFMTGISGGFSSWWMVGVSLACFSVTMLPLLLAVSLDGYQRLSVRDGEAITASCIPHIGRAKPKRIAMSEIDFVSCDKVTKTTDDGSSVEGLIVTAYLKDGSSEVLAQLLYCGKVAAALKNHLPGILSCDVDRDAVPLRARDVADAP